MEKKGKLVLLAFVLILLIAFVLIVESKKPDRDANGVFAKGAMPESAVAKANELYSSLMASKSTASVEVKVDGALKLKKTVDGNLNADQLSLVDQLVVLMKDTPEIKVLVSYTYDPSLDAPLPTSSVCDDAKVNVNLVYANCNLEVQNSGSVAINSADLSFSPSGTNYAGAIGALQIGQSQVMPLPPDEKAMASVTAVSHVIDSSGAPQTCSQSFSADGNGFSACY